APHTSTSAAAHIIRFATMPILPFVCIQWTQSIFSQDYRINRILFSRFNPENPVIPAHYFSLLP
ncbi:MAG: hypothetical protein LBW77_06665, partial [Verrucomicrobiota bacterium]|nr:hypothetical protein [Verrucomicrobiota bacterium]